LILNRANVSLEEIQQQKCYSFVAWKKDRDNGNWLFKKKLWKKNLHFTNYGVCGLFSHKNVWTVLLVRVTGITGQSYVLNETANALRLNYHNAREELATE
jgi:hypothetical protein